MTREEAEKYADNMTYCNAINNLMKARSIPYRKATFIKINELLKALEQEPCEDAVSRAELLKIYENRFVELQKIKHLKGNKGANDRQLGVNYCINILKEMPPVTPKGVTVTDFADKCIECGKQKKVQWIEIDDIHSKCVGCGAIFCISSSNEWKVNFCPNCGAKMESEG